MLVLGHFGSHFARGALYYVLQNFENILRAIAFYSYFVRNWYSIFENHIMTKNDDFCLHKGILTAILKSPSIGNLQKFTNNLWVIAFYWFCIRSCYSDFKKYCFPHFSVQIILHILDTFAAILKGAPFWESPEFWKTLYEIACYWFYTQNWYSNFKKYFSPHFSVQTMPKNGNFCLFCDILVTISKAPSTKNHQNFWKKYYEIAF